MAGKQPDERNQSGQTQLSLHAPPEHDDVSLEQADPTASLDDSQHVWKLHSLSSNHAQSNHAASSLLEAYSQNLYECSPDTDLTSEAADSQVQAGIPVMSKAPLLLRSAPGIGTGSYGAALPSTPLESSEDEHRKESRIRKQRKKDSVSQGSAVNHDTSASSSDDGPLVEGSRSIRMQSSHSRLRRNQSGSRSGRISSNTSRSRRLSSVSKRSNERLAVMEDIGLDSGYGIDSLPRSIHSLRKDVDTPENGEEVIDTDDDDPPDNSRYAQVRASVSAVDNTALSISTPRMWLLSLFFAILGSSTNLFFSLRYPSVAITPVIALLLVHPMGLMWDVILKRKTDPAECFVNGVFHSSKPSSTACSNIRLWLAQGRWNEKEHSCVYISSNVSFGFAFATDVIVEQTKFYKQEVSIIYQLLLILSTQIIGYTFAGLTRRFLVRPGGMIWPGTLMSAAMFTTLHKEENTVANGWSMTRWKFFFIVWSSSFAFYFLPGLLMPALSYFNAVTWLAPKNVVLANIFGTVSGLGLFPITFDWAQIAYIGSPLLTPFWAAMNVVGGLVLVMWVLAPLAYYRNWFSSSYMPMLSSSVFDNTGKVYDVSRILTSDFIFDRAAYQNYSRVYLPIAYVLSYGLQFAALASLLTHTLCWHGRDIWKQWRRSLKEVEGETKEYEAVPTEDTSVRYKKHKSRAPAVPAEDLLYQDDVHNRLMKRYEDAPMSWYLMTCFSMMAVGMFLVEYYPVHLPWYGLLLSLGLCSILFVPIGIVTAITNQQSSIYLICQLVCGAVFPGRPVANMIFVTYGYISSAQGIKFASDLKLGHYMKIPPRILFKVQMAATVISSITQIGVLNWMFLYVPGICTSSAINGFTCPIARVHFNGSILWGVVGPAEFFGPNAIYRPLVWCFLVGGIAPIPLYFYSRHKKTSIVRKINLPVLFGSLSWIPPATGLNFSVWALVCYVFNYVIKRRADAWWGKYTMTLSAALDSGLAFGLVIVFFGFVYPGWMDGFRWWGTEVYKEGCDWQACAYRVVEEGGTFGP